MNIKSIIYSLLLALAIVSCQSSSNSGDNSTNKKKIVVTTNIIGQSIKNILGDDVEINILMNSETDPHAYDPTPGDFKALNNADVIISNGLHLEGRMHEDIIRTAKLNNNKHIMMSNGLPSSALLLEDGIPDPHIWFNVKNWKKCINFSINELIDVMPEFKDKWSTKLAEENKKLDSLDTWVAKSIASIPENSRVLVTAHDAFSYFSQAYGIKLKPLQGRSTTSEPSVKDIITLSNFIVENKISSIFVESTVNKKFIESIKESCEGKNHPVKIGGELFSDALGVEGTKEGTYIGMIEHNITTIVKGLN